MARSFIPKRFCCGLRGCFHGLYLLRSTDSWHPSAWWQFNSPKKSKKWVFQRSVALRLPLNMRVIFNQESVALHFVVHSCWYRTWNLQTSQCCWGGLNHFLIFTYSSSLGRWCNSKSCGIFLQRDAFLKHQLWSNLEAQVEAETKLDQWMLCTWLQLYRLAMVSRSMHFRSGPLWKLDKVFWNEL